MSRCKAWKIAAILAIVTAGAAGGVVAVLDRMAGLRWRQALGEFQDDLAYGVPAYLQDQAKFRDQPWFTPHGRQANAAELLDGLPWLRGHYWGHPKQPAPSGRPTLKFPPKLLEELRETPHTWSQSPALRARFPDTSWMEAVHQYDHWEFAHADPPPNETMPPTPDFTELYWWCDIHLRRGIHNRDPAPAARDVRHVAQLLISTEDEIAAMLAAALLNQEADAHAYYVSQFGGPVEGWQPVSQELRDAFKRIVRGGPLYAGLFSQNEVRAKARDPKLAPVGYCISQDSAGRNLAMVRGLLRSHWPGVFADYEAELDTDLCRSVRVRRYWGRPDRVLHESDLALTPVFAPTTRPTGPDPVVLNCAEKSFPTRLICRRQALHIGMTLEMLGLRSTPYMRDND